MDITKEEIIEVLYESIGELNEQRSKDQQLAYSPHTPLEQGSGLDSLGFVNLVALVEEKCYERFGRILMLSGADLDPVARDPFETVGSLAEFIELQLTDRRASCG
jgi:acyl carrier protein